MGIDADPRPYPWAEDKTHARTWWVTRPDGLPIGQLYTAQQRPFSATIWTQTGLAFSVIFYCYSVPNRSRQALLMGRWQHPLDCYIGRAAPRTRSTRRGGTKKLASCAVYHLCRACKAWYELHGLAYLLALHGLALEAHRADGLLSLRGCLITQSNVVTSRLLVYYASGPMSCMHGSNILLFITTMVDLSLAIFTAS